MSKIPSRPRVHGVAVAGKISVPVKGFVSKESQDNIRAHVVEFWRRRGWRVVALVEKLPEGGPVKGWRLVTDMVNGLPKDLYASRALAEKVAS